MTITVDQKTLAVSVDNEAFQRGLMGLAVLQKIMAEMDADMLDSSNPPKRMLKEMAKKHYMWMLKELAKMRREIRREHAPPGIDQDALSVFCDES